MIRSITTPRTDALAQTARAFWQSRAGLKRAPQLVDLHELAREVRRAR